MTTALQQGTVELTWDEEDGARHNNIKKGRQGCTKFSFPGGEEGLYEPIPITKDD